MVPNVKNSPYLATKIAKTVHMAFNLVSDRPASVSLLRIFAMIILGFLLIGNVVAAMVISFLYTGDLIKALEDPAGTPDLGTILVIAQGLAALVGLVLVPWFYVRTFEQRQLRNFFGPFPNVLWFLVLSAVTVALIMGISPLTEWNANMQLPESLGGLADFMKDMEAKAAQLTTAMTSNLTPGSFLLVFVVVAVIPAIGEEFVFRGLIQTELQRALGNPHVAIWVGAAIFSAFHMQFFGFFPRLLIGALLGYLYLWSGSLWYPVLGHFLNNGLQVLGIYLMQQNVITYDMESTESAPIPLVGVSIVLLAGLLYYCKKNLTQLRDLPSELQ